MRADLWPAVEAGTLTMPIDKTSPPDDIAGGLELMRANRHFGKIVIAEAYLTRMR
jgi:NADPH2:quinone reductase